MNVNLTIKEAMQLEECKRKKINKHRVEIYHNNKKIFRCFDFGDADVLYKFYKSTFNTNYQVLIYEIGVKQPINV